MIQLDIDPEVEKRLIEAAHARGLDPSAYAQRILASAVTQQARTALRQTSCSMVSKPSPRMRLPYRTIPRISSPAR
jgi:hypothetical protein